MKWRDWLEHRTGMPTALKRLLEEPLPVGIGWLFTLGSILLLLLAIQVATGIAMAVYYAPTPDHAYDSVRYVISHVTFGRLIRNLHAHGATALIIVALLHLLRVFVFAAYKPPRELTWMSGVLLLITVLAFAMSGYLLPWDQRGYWGTTVTISIARGMPIFGDAIATSLQGGSHLGALTLTRWYVIHVIALPAILGALVIGHLFLMRRHGISGPLRARPGSMRPFFPDHAIKDACIVAIGFAVLILIALGVDAPLDARADPTDASYVPRPEWYLLGLFQLLKFFPGRWEIVGTLVLPGLLVLLLLGLPFLDRRSERWPMRRPVAMTTMILGIVVLVTLTSFGLRDVPTRKSSSAAWNLRAIGGMEVASTHQCARCHASGGIAQPLSSARLTRDDEWIGLHVLDPEMIAPDLRKPPREVDEFEVEALLAYIDALRTETQPPAVSARDRVAAHVLAVHCLSCHVVDGDGTDDGPELTHAGKERDAKWLAAWIAEPTAFEPDAEMPAFADKLTPEQLRIVAEYLAQRK